MVRLVSGSKCRGAGRGAWRGWAPAAVLVVVVCSGLQAPAAAAALDKAQCEALEAEVARLSEAGASADFDKGPAWAAANLTPARLASVRRLIEVNELLEFRCQKGRITLKLKAEEAEEENAVPPMPVRPPQRPAVRAKAAEPATEASAKPPGAQSPAAMPPAAKPKPKPRPKPVAEKPKINDAYSPAAAAQKGATPATPAPDAPPTVVAPAARAGPAAKSVP